MTVHVHVLRSCGQELHLFCHAKSSVHVTLCIMILNGTKLSSYMYNYSDECSNPLEKVASGDRAKISRPGNEAMLGAHVHSNCMVYQLGSLSA